MRIPSIKLSFSALVLPCLLLASVPVCAEDRFYRYVNAEGVTVIDDRVPPKFAHKGYAVLNRAGRVIEIVPRALTEAERKEADSGAVMARLSAEELERQRKYDNMLLGRYSSVEDIEAAQKRKVNEINVRINLLKGNIGSLKKQLEARQEEAAELERDAQAVSETLLQNIESLRAEIAENERLIGRHVLDRETTEARFSYDIERFRVLRPPRN